MTISPFLKWQVASAKEREAALGQCESVFGPQDAIGHRTVRQLTGSAALQALRATVRDPSQRETFEANIASARYGSLAIGIAHHSPAIIARQGDRYGHSHPVARLCVLIKGTVTFRVDDLVVKAMPGAALLHPDSMNLTYETREPATFVYIDIATEDPLFESISSTRNGAYWPESGYILGPLAAFIQAVLRRDDAAATSQERHEVRRALEALTLSVLAGAPALAGPGLEDSTRGLALDYIRRNHTNTQLTAASVAHNLGVSTRTLQRSFEHGRSVSQWITQLRVESALAILEDPRLAHLSVEAIAERAGFGSGVSLRRSVLSATGMTPCEYRTKSALASGVDRQVNHLPQHRGTNRNRTVPARSDVAV
jgi:AraC-like DNA-binding protein